MYNSLPTLDLDQATDKEDFAQHLQDFRVSVFRVEKTQSYLPFLRAKNEEIAEMEGFNTCLEYHGLTVHETLGYFYPDLEKTSGTKISQIVVSRPQLIELVLFFSTLRPRGDNSNDVGQLAFHVIEQDLDKEDKARDLETVCLPM
ncbi:hypothetical protein POM88_054260 [Heracleum sosnowskyi]|uniref:Uncharacterized protein n=1 Tax=Heracleum sosnowskyi TaxID=360622 RepID=A0AAD8LX29_9APIA|nr:hypothetical protein POM88_054260 [Heracleum sosnowskyi]